MPGPALVSDFDGTLADLEVDWVGLRAELGVRSILALWDEPFERWEPVTRAEVAAATGARSVRGGAARAEAAGAVAILTNNAEASVHRFLERMPALAAVTCAVIGRESLAGPKNDPVAFERGFRRAVEALTARLGAAPESVEYQGDQDYELELAASLGAVVHDVRTEGRSGPATSV